MPDSIFGPIVTGSDVLDAVEQTVRTWQTTYLAEMERRTGRAPQALPPIRTFTRAADFSGWPEDQLPTLLMICPGVEGEPTFHGDGTVDGTWSVGLAAVVSASTAAATAELAKLYAAAFRTLLLQHPNLDGFADGLKWGDESYDDLPSEDGRTLAAGQVVFGVSVRNVARTSAGPADPPQDPYETPTLPEVTSTDVGVTNIRPPETIPEEG